MAIPAAMSWGRFTAGEEARAPTPGFLFLPLLPKGHAAQWQSSPSFLSLPIFRLPENVTCLRGFYFRRHGPLVKRLPVLEIFSPSVKVHLAINATHVSSALPL